MSAGMQRFTLALVASIAAACGGAAPKSAPPPAHAEPAAAPARPPVNEVAPAQGALGCADCGGDGYGGATYASAFASLADADVGGAGVRQPSVQLGAVATPGALDREAIRGGIKAHIGKIKYCYEKELLADPSLQGTVQATFTIGATGRVVSSTATGINARLATCIADAVAAIEFPPPAGGGNVNVTYPFVFRPEGG